MTPGARPAAPRADSRVRPMDARAPALLGFRPFRFRAPRVAYAPAGRKGVP